MDHKLTSDLWYISADGGESQQVTHHMPQGLKDFPFVEPELIHYKSKDGLDVPAWLYRPHGAYGTLRSIGPMVPWDPIWSQRAPYGPIFIYLGP